MALIKSDIRNILDFAPIWNLMRFLMDACFGFYEKRKEILSEWEVSEGTILDVGCGSGHFSVITNSKYLGVDFNAHYIKSARAKYGNVNRKFEVADVLEISAKKMKFDNVLFIGIIHHVDDDTAIKILTAAKEIACDHVVIMEVVREQTNLFGTLIMKNDRGKHVRTNERIFQLLANAGLQLVEHRPLRLGPLNTTAILCSVKQNSSVF